ncbi:MAG TPA: CAP domain-containing protein [Pirellulales bacterium]|jgi:uncharacterized protein YkwD
MYGYMAAVALLMHPADPAVLDLKAASQGLNRYEHQVIERTNVQRKQHGLKPLQVDLRLVRSARRHTAWMTRNQNLQHTTAPVGENIAMGQRSSGEVVTAWMNSPGHRQNILNSGYRKIGVAAYTSKDGSVYWCQQFLR